MSADPLRLDALVESVADGADVDWSAVEAAADAVGTRGGCRMSAVFGRIQWAYGNGARIEWCCSTPATLGRPSVYW